MNTVYGVVYCVTNLVNGKMYVGQTTRTISARWNQHKNKLRKSCTALSNAIALYGANSFEIKEVCKASNKDELDFLEAKFIADLGTLSPNGYNLRLGGSTYGKFSEEAKARLKAARNTETARRRASAISRANWKNPEYRQEMSTMAKAMWKDPQKRQALTAAIKQASQSPVRRQKLSILAKARMLDPVYVAMWKAAINTPEARKKKSVAAVARWQTALARERHAERIRNLFSDDEYRLRFCAAASKAWDDDRKARQSQTSKALQADPNKQARSDSSSGVRGVRLHTATGRWQARIGLPGGLQKSLGLFESIADASEAYKAAKISLNQKQILESTP
jgi:group I intron endonuclease